MLDDSPEAPMTAPEKKSFDHLRRLQRRGLLQGMAGVVVATVFLALDRPTMAGIAGAVALAVMGAAAVAPLQLQSFLRRLERIVGTGLAFLLLAPVFYLVMLPFGLLFRSGRRNRLAPRPDPDAATYWQPRPERPTGTAPFERQF